VGGLLEEHQVQLTTLADLVAGAVDARLNPTYRQKEDVMSSSARQGQQKREVAVDHDEVSREEIRAELQAREAKLQASADAVEDRKKKSLRNSPFTEAQEAALGPTLFTSPRSN
jgi:hypothetical protein